MRPLLGINSSSVPSPSTCPSRTTEKNIEADKCSYFHSASERSIYLEKRNTSYF